MHNATRNMDKEKTMVILWIVQNMIIPLLPIIVRIIVCLFSIKKVTIIVTSELLYYSFTVNIILVSNLWKSGGFGSIVLSIFPCIISLIDIVIIGFDTVGMASLSANVFAITAAISCFALGVIYRIMQYRSSNGGEI